MTYGNDSADLDDLHERNPVRERDSFTPEPDDERCPHGYRVFECPDCYQSDDEDTIGRCPQCGSTDGMIAHRFIGRDAGTGEPVDDTWLECVACGARTTEEKIAR